jgi:selenide, water dikinase
MKDSSLLVGTETSDDAAVYKITEDIALIETLDFFTPVVDDPYTFGQIAAANSLSDIYAMGGEPKMALNIVCFPACLPIEVLSEILKGGSDKVLEAGAIIVGGHTVDDNEPKYGLSVTGIVNPNKILRNNTAKEGDLLILTKPIGIGIINAAIKGQAASPKAYKKAVEVMTTLNKYAFLKVKDMDINSCTDITGFGLMGHLYEMASGSSCSMNIYKDRIPVIEDAFEYAEMGLVPGGTYRNKKYLDGKYSLTDVEDYFEDILFDPQTSGGLLLSMKEEEAKKAIIALKSLSLTSAIIGEVTALKDKYIYVK